MNSVLFVCTANLCRSPMAMGLLKISLGPEASRWRIESAGTWAQEGLPAVAKTRQVVMARGLDLSSQRSRSITRSLMQEFNLILVMERGHKEALGIEYPKMRHKTFLLSEMIGQRFDIADPMGRSQAEFEDTAREIEAILSQGLERIRQLSTGSEAG